MFNSLRGQLGGSRLARVAMLTVVAALASAGQASAATGVWQVRSVFAPAPIPPGGSGEMIVTVTNLGDATIAASEADPVKVGVRLPAGVTATSIENFSFLVDLGGHFELPEMSCEQGTLTCEGSSGFVYPYETIEIVVGITASANAQSGSKARLSASGGGASQALSEAAIPVGTAAPAFGIEHFEQVALNEDGSLDTQAGSHPFQFTTTFSFNQGFHPTEGENKLPGTVPLAAPKEVAFDLPPGVVGDPTAVPECPIKEFDPGAFEASRCQQDTAIGVALVTVSFHGVSVVGGIVSQLVHVLEPVYNLTPAVGEPARFGFLVEPGITPSIPVYLDTSVRTGGDYGVTVSVHNISQQLWFVGAQTTFWGVPGDPRHNLARGECVSGFHGKSHGTACTPEGESFKEVPFLTLPTSCTGTSGSMRTQMEAISWTQPGERLRTEYALHEDSGRSLGLTGCNRLGIDPSISVTPDSQAASVPTGLTVGVHVPQAASLNPNGLSQSSVRDMTVALPAGVALNPAAADGLEACSEAQVGLSSAGEVSCPAASKVGTLEIQSPLLPNALTGAAYLAAQNANPFGSLVALYLVARDPVSGVLVKLAGEVKPDSVTGQLVSTFKDTPQLPFEDLKLHFFGGSRAPLSTPALCGGYTTTASIAPWSGNPPVEPTSEFQILGGPNGSPCANPLPFSPSLTAGSTNIQTGAFTPFTMTMSREDGQQDLQAVQLHMPPGLLGTLSGVKLCGETEANAGTCGPESLIGETIVSVGLGDSPFSVKGGRVYITGPYHGAPFGLSIVNPAKAGPYDLGQVIVRAKIEVDPITAALTVTTDSSGPYAIPQILDGIPLQIKHVNVTVNRPDFTFNPTNCAPTAITGNLTSSQGASSALSVPFQVTNCATLGFKPQFKVSTAGKTSRANGASLDVKLAYPKAAWGSQANIKSVKVDLPKQLPSRLTTLQKACPDSTFNQNPASCAAGSRVGTATARTPIIPVGLSGPAYFVSHGGAKFPELVIVLSGYGVTVQLHGETFISSAGITSSTFRTVPDVPIGSFELKLPQGKGSALAANGNLCTSTLKMPTTFTAQNGLRIKQSTPINATGCARHKKTKKAKKTGGHHKGSAHGKK